MSKATRVQFDEYSNSIRLYRAQIVQVKSQAEFEPLNTQLEQLTSLTELFYLLYILYLI